MVLCEEVLSRKVGHKEWESRMLKHMVFTLGKSRDKVWHISMNGNVAEVHERLCAPGHASEYPLEGYKTVLILETPFWVAGAAESMKISIIVIGASNKSGRH
jgi:hypothetical protein